MDLPMEESVKIKPVTLEIGGQTVEVSWTVNSMAEAEQRLGAGITQLFEEHRFGLNTLRLLLWAGLLKANPRVKVEEAGQLIERDLERGESLANITNAIMDAMRQAGIIDLIAVQAESEKNATAPKASSSGLGAKTSEDSSTEA